MDPKLAEIYGTNQATDADLEKLAAAELADGLANDDQLDTDGLSEEELEAVAQDVLNAGAEEGGEEVEEQEKTSAAEAQEKLAEADYLGRVMAHSYVNELRSIEKTAGTDFTGAISAPVKKSVGEAIKGLATRAGHGVTRTATDIGAAVRGSYGGKFGREAGKAGIAGLGGATLSAGQRAKILGKAGAGLAVAGGAAYGAKKGVDAMSGGKGKSKKSSAMDTLVEARAMEILQASGIDPAELEQVEGQEKVSDPREALAAAVDERAWAVLGQYGVVPNEE